jgi:uracil-DNA glycosylase family 4
MKPPSCNSCVLERIGTGYASSIGSDLSDIMFVGESLGAEEVYKSEPFSGPAGWMLNSLLSEVKLFRTSSKIDNLLRCRPPGNELRGASYQFDAINHCNTRHLRPSIQSWAKKGDPSKKVLVPLGQVPLRQILQLTEKKVRIQDFHGTVTRDPTDSFWVVPTYHPSHLVRGAHNLYETCVFDLTTALEVSARGGPEPDPVRDEPGGLWIDPPPDEFNAWVDMCVAAMEADPEFMWLAVDIKTPEKSKKGDEGELTHKDRDYHITRINFAINPDQGVTVPHETAYIGGIKRLLAARGTKVFWNGSYDLPRLKHNGHQILGTILDAMWMWHFLQSDTPRGLGYVAPFFSPYGAWKHLSSTEPEKYAAIDGFQTLRIAHGVRQLLESKGMWHYYWRHCYLLDQYVLQPSEDVGWLVDQKELFEMDARLEARRTILNDAIQPLIPEELKPLGPNKAGWVSPPDPSKVDPSKIVERAVEDTVNFCSGCESVVKTPTHKKLADGKTPCPAPSVSKRPMAVTRYFERLPFNLRASGQILAYILAKGHKPGKDKKTKKDSANKDCIDRLARTTKDPLYPVLLETRQIDKVHGTYVRGSLKRLGLLPEEDPGDPRSREDGRLHPSTGFKPSTYRLSQQNPNLQNVIADRGSYGESIAGGFRYCLVAGPGCSLIEADFSGIEAVQVGWFARDPDYIRLAKLGVHAYLASHLAYQRGLIDEPASVAWDDVDLLVHFNWIKAEFDELYNQAKRCVHATSYGMTARGLHQTYPKLFPTERAAAEVQALFFTIAKSVHVWQAECRENAARHGYLGGASHPFRYVHKFYNIFDYRPVKGYVSPDRARKMTVVRKPDGRGGYRNMSLTLGADAKRCVAFYPQSTAAGVIKEAMLRLFMPDSPSYIGDAYFGRTPLRAQVHDSLVLEVPTQDVERILEILTLEMRRPIAQQPIRMSVGGWLEDAVADAYGFGDYLTIGVEAKVGQNWASYNDRDDHGRLNLVGMKKVKLKDVPDSLAADTSIVPMDLEDDELTDSDISEILQQMDFGEQEREGAV